MDLVLNKDIILTKNAILHKSVELLQSLQDRISDHINIHGSFFPEEVRAATPKISKGENYMGLPYRILDHPRYFLKDDIMAVRTLFWWGNFFSMTLHLSGKYKTAYAGTIESNYQQWKEQGLFICVNTDPWEHHFEKHNYIPVSALDRPGFGETIRENNFIKLSCQLPIEEWDNAPEKLFNYFQQMMEGIGDQLPKR